VLYFYIRTRNLPSTYLSAGWSFSPLFVTGVCCASAAAVSLLY